MVKMGRIHLPSRGVTWQRCDLLPNYFGHLFITLAASAGGKRNVSVWVRPSVRPSDSLSVCPVFFPTLIGRARSFLILIGHAAHLNVAQQGQLATRPAYISVPVLEGRTYFYERLSSKWDKILVIRRIHEVVYLVVDIDNVDEVM